MEWNSIIVYVACVAFLFIVGRFFIVPLRKLLKLVLNSILGGILIFVINIIGSFFSFHIGLNFLTSILVGFLGIPRCNPFNRC